MFLPYNAPVSPPTAPIVLPSSVPMFPSQPNMFASLPPSHLTSFRLPAFVESGSPHQIPRYPSQISPISPFGSTSQHPFTAERNYSDHNNRNYIVVDGEASLPTYIRNGVRVFDGPAVPPLPELCGEYEMMMARRQFELSYKFPGSPEGRSMHLFPKQPNSEQKPHETGKFLERNYTSGGNSLNMNPSDNANRPISTFRPDEILAKRCFESGKRKRVEVEQLLSIETSDSVKANVGSAVKLCRNVGNSDSRQLIKNNNRVSKLANVTNEQRTGKIEGKTNTVSAIGLDRADKNETIRKHNIWRPAIDSCYEKQSTEIQFHPTNTAAPQIWNPHYPVIPNKIPNIETNVSKLGGSVVKQPSPIPAATASPGSNPATDFYTDASSHWWSVSETTSQLLPSQIPGQPRRSDTVHGLLSVANGYIVARTRRCRRCRCPNCVNPSPPSPDSTMEPGSSPTTKKLHICHVAGCGKVYGKTSHLKAHLRWHAGERPFVCTWMFCRKCFTRSDELQRHIKTHTGDKKFCCRECGKRFTRSDHLSKHNKTHEQRRDGGRVEPANQTYSSHKPRPNKQLKHAFSSQTPDRKTQPTKSINGRGYNEPISTQDNHVTSASHWNEDTQRKRTTQVDQNDHVQSDVVSCLESESSKREVWVQNSADEESLESELSDDEEIDVDV